MKIETLEAKYSSPKAISVKEYNVKISGKKVILKNNPWFYWYELNPFYVRSRLQKRIFEVPNDWKVVGWKPDMREDVMKKAETEVGELNKQLLSGKVEYTEEVDGVPMKKIRDMSEEEKLKLNKRISDLEELLQKAGR